MIHTRVFLIATVAVFANLVHARAQEAIIKLVDSTKVSTQLVNVSDRSLVTEAGSFNLTEIYSVKFLSVADYQKRMALAKYLNDFGIMVFVVDKQLPPSPKEVVSANRNKYNEEDKFVESEKMLEEEETTHSYVSFGLGLGIDYGGIGARLTILPDKHVGFFGAAGYVIAGFGYNFGATVFTSPNKRLSPYFSLMYGYNAAIVVSSTTNFNPSGTQNFSKIYYGPSLGGGVRLASKHNNNYWSFGLVFAFRSEEFRRDINRLKQTNSLLVEPLPINISVGYNFGF
jgi:hypothetical protein